ncbi:MAG: ABC transporter ATP-binding protein [Gammaproteobacteria bacterium]|nr:ABC transporter ATP-binding protein [Gammaproteobacteria bacterium]
MVSAPGIHLNQVSLAYAGQWLFERLSLQLPAAKCSCLLGPSGVGKSSLLQLIAGILPLAPEKGEISTSDGLALKGRVAYMAQTDLLLPWASVVDNVILGEKLRRGRWRVAKEHKERALHYLQQVGLSDYAQHKPAQLSQGMRQRVALARTLFEDKPIVLMDEPFSALDVVRKLELQSLAVEMLRDRTVFWITHDPLEALRVGEAIFVLAGLPAHIHYQVTPVESVPRDVRQANIIALEAELIAALCHKDNPC